MIVLLSNVIVCNSLPPSHFLFLQPQADQLTEEQIAGRNTRSLSTFLPLIHCYWLLFHHFHNMLFQKKEKKKSFPSSDT